MNFTRNEKLAIIKVLSEIIIADGRKDKREMDYMAQILTVLDEKVHSILEASKLGGSESLSVLGNMTDKKKIGLGIMMSEMIGSDGHIDENELKLFNGVFISVGIPMPKNV